MTGITDGVPYLTQDIITGSRITFSRHTDITSEVVPIPDAAIMWNGLAVNWYRAEDDFQLTWSALASSIPDTSVVWSSAALGWGGDGFEIIWS